MAKGKNTAKQRLLRTEEEIFAAGCEDGLKMALLTEKQGQHLRGAAGAGVQRAPRHQARCTMTSDRLTPAQRTLLAKAAPTPAGRWGSTAFVLMALCDRGTGPNHRCARGPADHPGAAAAIPA
jgi:hypothetical protein